MLEQAAKTIPVFYSANMSLGINLLTDLVKKTARLVEQNFDIEIIEKHHNQKLDAPSGTALEIADCNQLGIETISRNTCMTGIHAVKRESRNEIGIHAVRGGTIVGEHTVIFAGNDEIIEISHTAMSKDIFGTGALRAAEFIHGKKPGIYNMDDLISEDKKRRL
ncbi:MAG: 4-hydroxy-tetrahydrodipicolinate reductase [Acetivibrionales bacterium]